MARPMGPRFKVARRFGVNLYNHPKALKRGAKPLKKQSEYARQLNEKQKLKAYYDMLEKQFVRYVDDAMASKGNAADHLVQRLECRLDNIVYRLGFASSLRQARQMVVHGHILVDGTRLDRPSFRVGVDSIISLYEKSRSIDMFRDNFQNTECYLPYLQKDVKNFSGNLISIPERSEVPIEVTDSLVIEFYSK